MCHGPFFGAEGPTPASIRFWRDWPELAPWYTQTTKEQMSTLQVHQHLWPDHCQPPSDKHCNQVINKEQSLYTRCIKISLTQMRSVFLKQVPWWVLLPSLSGTKVWELGSSQVMLNWKTCFRTWFMCPKHCFNIEPGNQTWSSPKENPTEMQIVCTAGPRHQCFFLYTCIPLDLCYLLIPRRIHVQ